MTNVQKFSTATNMKDRANLAASHLSRHPLNGILPEDSSRLAESLRTILADTCILKMKVQGFHWNAEGAGFLSLHSLTEGLYKDLESATDRIAERIRALGFRAPGTLAELLKVGTLKEDSTVVALAIPDMLRQLSADHQFVARQLRETIGLAEPVRDVVTIDLLTGLLSLHEDAVWKIRSSMLQ